jgi:uncharacterized protein (TIGR01244 family)
MGDKLKVNDALFVGRGQPSEEELRALAAEGFASVVDLRQGGEGGQVLSPPLEAAASGRHGLRYLHLPTPTDRIDAAMLDRFHRALKELPAPVFVHCASGKRSGTFALASATIESGQDGHAAVERIAAEGAAYGSDAMRDAVKRYVDHQTSPVRDRSRPAAPARLARALPPTTTRVERNTSAAINRRIALRIDESIRWHAAHPAAIDGRLAELDREWDMERTLEANAATVALGGVLLAAFVDRRFLAVPAAVATFLLQHALQGWCPPVPFFRRRGVRTASEIERERTALRALRGDFATTETGEAPEVPVVRLARRPFVARRSAAPRLTVRTRA